MSYSFSKLIAVSLFVCSTTLVAAPIWTCDFGKPACVDFKAPKWEVPKDGTSARSGGIAFHHMLLKGFTNLPARVRFSCEVREIRRDPARPGHWGVNFTTVDRTHLHTHCAGTGLIAWVNSPGGGKLASASGGEKVVQEKWTPVEFDFVPSGITARIGGGTCFQIPVGMVPAGVDVLFYNVDAEIRNVRFVSLPPPERGPIFSEEEGGFMCWARYAPGHRIAEFLDAAGKVKGRLDSRGDGYITFDSFVEGRAAVNFRRRWEHEWERDRDTIHVAFSWYRNGTARLFVNGIPYAPDMRAGENSRALMLGNEMAKVVRAVPCGEGPNTQAPEDFHTFNRSLTNREVYETYRQRMPVDVRFMKDPPIAGPKTVLTLTVVPGGTYLKPKPFEDMELSKAIVDVAVKTDRIVKTGTKREFVPVPGACRAWKAVAVDGPVDLRTEPTPMEKGRHRVVVTVNGRFTRSLFVDVADEIVLPSAQPSDDEWKLGRTVYEKAFAQPSDVEFHQGATVARTLDGIPYLEAGANGSLNSDRFGTVVPFAEADLGKPHLITFTWPDDKMRAIGLVMHPQAFKAKHETYHRDRLQGGLLAGDAYRTTGKMQTSSFLFYPAKTNYLFECRTQIDGRPGAVARMTIREIVGEWPVLKVYRPKGLPSRRFGYNDEDQTFVHNLNSDQRGDYAEIASETLRYFAYTGQNLFLYGSARYWTSLGPIEHSNGQGLWPFRTDYETKTIKAFARAGVDWVGFTYMARTPEEELAERLDVRREDCFTCDREGNTRTGNRRVTASLASRRMNELFLDNFMDNLGILRGAGLAGVYAGFGSDAFGGYGTWRGLNWGYDDVTVGRFARETGTELPSACRNDAGGKRFHARYDFLTASNSLQRAKWIRWRADRVTDYVKLYRERLDAVDAQTPLYLPLGMKDEYEEKGVDVEALARVKGVRLVVSRSPTGVLFPLYRRRVKPEEFGGDGMNYDLRNLVYARIRAASGGSVDFVTEHNVYWETFRNSLCPERFNTYFQSLDLKPWGRNFLRTFAYDVAMFDAKAITIGDQPIGTLGNERESREFAKAFRALPALPFTDVFEHDGVVCRRLDTENGIYFYLVNTTADERPETCPVKGRVTDLSTNAVLAEDEITLLPYQLRSFIVVF